MYIFEFEVEDQLLSNSILIDKGLCKKILPNEISVVEAYFRDPDTVLAEFLTDIYNLGWG
ncbi:MAG: hypothetical protein Q9M91_00630 [Candidatus Dojkabacteria bacterium]|nr:hypothetical protein [Candidatus Dojkabacteria bacterium]